VLDVQVIEDRAVARAALGSIRSRILAELAEPASAAALAARIGITRQKVNYHLRALESHGLVRVTETRKWGGLTERLLVATAASYVLSPGDLGPASAEERSGAADDVLSSSYLVSLAARVVREVGELVRRANEAGKRLPTLSLDTEIRFRSARERAAFSRELADTVAALAARYHDESAPGGRAHRLVIVAHPKPQEIEKKEPPHVRED